MTTGPLTNNALTTYTYDARNRLSAVGNLQYGYDPAGNRIAMTNGASVTRFVMDPNAKLSQALMRVRTGVTNYYIYGPGLLYQITETATTTNTLTYHYDLRGSTIALTDNNGNVTDRAQYSGYGMIMVRGGTNDTPFLYNGRYGVMTDPNGLVCMRARNYNPYLCRFINPDPAGFAGGLNWYCYADGNPISNLDPFGLWSWTQTFGVVKVFGGVGEGLAGGSLAIASSWTGLGAVAGGAVAVHGLDTIQSGFRQAVNGQAVDSFTSQGLQAAGVSRNTANLVDTGVSVVGSAGAGIFNGATKVAAIAQTEEAAGMSTWQILNGVDQGSKALPTAVWEGLGGSTSSALAKAGMIGDGAEGAGGLNLLQAIKLAPTGLTPLADFGAAAIGATFSGAAGAYQYGNSQNHASSTGK
jgi:RHS repeat-associated protein